MEAGSFIQNGERARRKTRQSFAIQSLRSSIAGGVASFRNSDTSDEVDDLVIKVLETIDDEATKAAQNGVVASQRAVDPESERLTDADIQAQKELRNSYFWTYFLAIPIIFTHGVATRMQFMYGGLYGRDGLNLNNALAILAVGCTAMGRATAPPLLKKYFNNPYFFMFLNAATLIGTSMMYLVPYVGGKDNFNEDGIWIRDDGPATVGSVLFFYLTMYIQGLAEVLSGWDMLMKFEMRSWTPDQQQLAFRVSFVSIALGSATAFAGSSWLFYVRGLYGCAHLGVAMGAFNVVFPGIYLKCRWGAFDYWRKGGNKKRTMASRRSQPLMKMLNLDELDDSECFASTQQLKFVPAESQQSHKTSIYSTSIRQSTLRGSIVSSSSGKQTSSVRVSEYAKPKNYFEFQKQLQHQTSERLVTNFELLKNSTTGFLQEQIGSIDNTVVIDAFDPNLLLTHSKHIRWPKDFKQQIRVMRWFCIISLALGSMMISSQFAVYVLYLVDVWELPVVYAGTSMAVGEISGMFTLLISIYLGNRRSGKEGNEESKNGEDDDPISQSMRKPPVEDMEKLSKSGSWKSLLRSPSLLFEVPSMFVVTCFLAVIPLALLGFLSPGDYDPDHEQIRDDELSLAVEWSSKLILVLCSGVGVGIVNCVMHATTIEMAALLLPEDLFGSAVAWGYSFRRITNLFVCLCATGLYSVSEFLVYQCIAAIYLISVPASIYILAKYIKCMPWQDREVVFEKSVEHDVEVNGLSNSFAASLLKELNAEDKNALQLLEEDMEEDSDESGSMLVPSTHSSQEEEKKEYKFNPTD